MGGGDVSTFPYVHGGFVASLPFDRRLAKADILGSLAHVDMLIQKAILPQAQGEALMEGLRMTYAEVQGGLFPYDESLEDIHTNVEARLYQLVGEEARGLHTARSRNDQVALDERLWVRETAVAILHELHHLEQVLVDLSHSKAEVILPGYTHLQRAQPILLAHYLLAHAWAMRRDFDRMAHVYNEASTCPLGAGALAGSGLPIDPHHVANLLAFHGSFENSLDAVQDRDFLASFVFANALLGLHLARLAEDLVIWSTTEFGFVRLQAAGGGSSLMVHKSNPDVAELVRAKVGRLVGNLVALLTVLKGLPSGYQKDLQEDKPPAFDTADTILAALKATSGFLTAVEFDSNAMGLAASDPKMLSVDRVEGLVSQGVPFRDAYNAVARGQGRAGRTKRAANGGGPSDPKASVALRTSPGGSSPASVEHQLKAFEGALGRQAYVLAVLTKELARAEGLLEIKVTPKLEESKA